MSINKSRKNMSKYLLVIYLMLIISQSEMVGGEPQYGYELENKYTWRVEFGNSYTYDYGIILHNSSTGTVFNATETKEFVRGDREDYLQSYEEEYTEEYRIMGLFPYFNRHDPEFIDSLDTDPSYFDYYEIGTGFVVFTINESNYTQFSTLKSIPSVPGTFTVINITRTFFKENGILLQSYRVYEYFQNGNVSSSGVIEYNYLEAGSFDLANIITVVGVVIIMVTAVFFILRRFKQISR